MPSPATAGSGLVFATYAGLHIVNTMTANLGFNAYEATLRSFRRYYQNPVFEAGDARLRILATSHHQRPHRSHGNQRGASPEVLPAKMTESQAPPRNKEIGRASRLLVDPCHSPPLFWVRGRSRQLVRYFLTIVIWGHAAATRFAPAFLGFQYDMTALSASLIKLPYLFYPYYMLLGSLGLYHTAYGTVQACRVFGKKVPVNLRGKGFALATALGSAVVVSAILAMGGNYYELPKDRFVALRSCSDEWQAGSVVCSPVEILRRELMTALK